MEIVQSSFEDLDAMCSALRAWDMEFYPLAAERNGGTVAGFVQAFGQGFRYGYAAFAPALSMFGAPPEGLITFNIMEPAKRRYWVRGHDLDDGMAWVFPVGAELRSVSAPGFKVHTLSVSEERIEQIAAGQEIVPPPPSKRPETFLVPAKVLPLIRRHLNNLHGGLTALPIDLVNEVLRLLVLDWLGPCSRGTGKRPMMKDRGMAVRRCLDLIESYDPAFGRIPNHVLLAECGASERTLQYAFRERFGMTPSAFIKSRRLAKVKSVLRRADPHADTVGDIAALFGFWHLGQFAVDYRKAFGERPSETLRKPFAAE